MKETAIKVGMVVAVELSAAKKRYGKRMKQLPHRGFELHYIDNGNYEIFIVNCGAGEIASRSRGTPRIANRFLKRVRDFAQVMGDGVITRETASMALDRMEVDALGLDSIDRLVLTTMIRNYNGGPVGLETIAAAVGEEAITIEDVYEPYLMQIGFLSRTPRGRTVTPAAYRHLGIAMPGQQQFDI